MTRRKTEGQHQVTGKKYFDLVHTENSRQKKTKQNSMAVFSFLARFCIMMILDLIFRQLLKKKRLLYTISIPVINITLWSLLLLKMSGFDEGRLRYTVLLLACHRQPGV